jgi:hypothetical protein
VCGLVGIPDLAKTRCGYSERLLRRFVTETLRVVLNVTPETRWPALNVTPETRRGFSPARRFDGLGSPRLAPWHGAPVTRRRSGATNLASDVDKRTMRINAMARRGRSKATRHWTGRIMAMDPSSSVVTSALTMPAGPHLCSRGSTTTHACAAVCTRTTRRLQLVTTDDPFLKTSITRRCTTVLVLRA